MPYSVHIPLWFGTLKIKSENRLRSKEKDGRLPVWRIGDIYFVWASSHRLRWITPARITSTARRSEVLPALSDEKSEERSPHESEKQLSLALKSACGAALPSEKGST
jgi:hypothetical protein